MYVALKEKLKDGYKGPGQCEACLFSDKVPGKQGLFCAWYNQKCMHVCRNCKGIKGLNFETIVRIEAQEKLLRHKAQFQKAKDR